MNNYLKLYNWKFWLVLFVLTIGVSYYFLPPQIPLYYLQALKTEKIARSYELFILPLFIVLLYFVTGLLISKLSLANRNMQLLIKYTVIIVSLLTYLELLRIIFIII
jgi:uncharacterized membrane protein